MRLIDADEALRMIRNSKADNPCRRGYESFIWRTAHDCAISCVEAAPAVDAVEVVRCKDCKHLRKDGAYIYCGRFHGMIVIRINDYCNYGERRTDADN